jgi:hypothetical protein
LGKTYIHMASTIQDFVKAFTHPSDIGAQQASQYMDRFASNRPEDREFDNRELHAGTSEYLKQMPENTFHAAAQNAFNQAQPQQRQGLLGSLIGALTGRGLDIGSLASQLGLGSTNPQNMGATDYARLANYARLNHPEAIQDHVQSQPWLVKAMGSPVVLGALGIVATRMLRRI